jgi:hypothetical protein
MPFFGLSTSRMSICSSSGLGSGLGGGGEYLGDAAANAAATSPETARLRRGVDDVGAEGVAVEGAKTGEDVPAGVGVWAAPPGTRKASAAAAAKDGSVKRTMAAVQNLAAARGSVQDREVFQPLVRQFSDSLPTKRFRPRWTPKQPTAITPAASNGSAAGSGTASGAPAA